MGPLSRASTRPASMMRVGTGGPCGDARSGQKTASCRVRRDGRGRKQPGASRDPFFPETGRIGSLVGPWLQPTPHPPIPTFFNISLVA